MERRVGIQWRINLYEALFQYLSVSYQREIEEILSYDIQLSLIL